MIAWCADPVRTDAVRTDAVRTDEKGIEMADDKTKHSAEGALGKAKEATGKATGDKDMQAGGRKDQSKADLKKAGDKVKDAFKR